MPIKATDLSGTTYGNLTVLRRDFSRTDCGPRWECQCSCGKVKTLFATQLRQGKTTSCGCKLPEEARARAITHGRSKTPEYRSWCSMNSRCNNRGHHAYPHYGGRGITVCERWKSFELFLADMGPRPSLKHSIDRIDVNGNYEPGNCRWATTLEQRLSSRGVRNVEINGVTRRLKEWADISAIPFDVLFKRLQAGWDPMRAITQPRRVTIRQHRPH